MTRLTPSRALMKQAPILYQIRAGRRSITLFSDLRIQVKGPRVSYWCFPSVSLSSALHSVDRYAKEYPRAKWTITLDHTDEGTATR